VSTKTVEEFVPWKDDVIVTATSKRFVPFTEENEWEGETWIFWLQLDGNEDELVRLHELTYESDTYHLNLDDIESERTVDRMVRRAEVGYMYSDNKVTGRFLCPELTTKEHLRLNEVLNDLFYKGGIQTYFRE
jgi:hypothetical protein